MIRAVKSYERTRTNLTTAQIQTETHNPVHRFGRAIHLDAVMATCPPTIKEAQEEINKVLIKDHEGLLSDVPGMLNVINKDLRRPPRFILNPLYTPPKEDLVNQLSDIHSIKPSEYADVIHWLIQAVVFQQPPHPRQCPCALCAHMRSSRPTSQFANFFPHNSAF